MYSDMMKWFLYLLIMYIVPAVSAKAFNCLRFDCYKYITMLYVFSGCMNSEKTLSYNVSENFSLMHAVDMLSDQKTVRRHAYGF